MIDEWGYDRRPVKMTGADRLRFCCQNAFGFITERELEDITNDPDTRDVGLLVRGSKGRFVVPARMVKHYIELIEADPDDRVRDICVPAADFSKWGGALNRREQ